MSDRKNVKQTGRETCYFCGSDGPIESHHILPRRYGGGDDDLNLVDLCPTCHQRLERLYNADFYATLGVGDGNEQVEIIHQHVANRIEEVRYELADELSRIESHILNTYVRGDIDELGWRDFHEMDEEGPEYTLVVKNDGSDVSQRERIRDVLQAFDRVGEYDNSGPGASKEHVVEMLVDVGYEESELEHEIEQLRTKGEIYQPQPGRWLTTQTE